MSKFLTESDHAFGYNIHTFPCMFNWLELFRMTDLMWISVKSFYIVLSGDAFENYFIVCVQLSGFFIIYYFIFPLYWSLLIFAPTTDIFFHEYFCMVDWTHRCGACKQTQRVTAFFECAGPGSLFCWWCNLKTHVLENSLNFFYPLLFVGKSGQHVLTKVSVAVPVSKGGLCSDDLG